MGNPRKLPPVIDIELEFMEIRKYYIIILFRLEVSKIVNSTKVWEIN